MNELIVLKWFEKYPKLEAFICAGTISLKAARTILDVDKDYMYTLYLELLQAGAVVGCGSTTFRATPELKKYIDRRRQADVDQSQDREPE